MPQLNYELTGPEDAPVLVLVSSIGTTMAMWDEQIARLNEDFRLLRYDHPGHGASEDPAPELTVPELARGLYRLLGELEIDRFALWGISMGGMVSMHVARHHPEQVYGMVLSATALGFPSADPWNARAEKVRSEGLGSIADLVMERYFDDSFRAEHADTVDRFKSALLACSAEGYARCCEALGRWDFKEADQIAVPTLNLVGSEDSALPAVLTEAVGAAIPGAQTHHLAGAGHLHSVEQPDSVTALARRHLATALSEAHA